MRWIKCADEMPPDNTPVLVYGIVDKTDEDGGSGAGDLVGKPMLAVYAYTVIYGKPYSGNPTGRLAYWGSVGDCGYEHEDCMSAPTHWMLLPDPPI